MKSILKHSDAPSKDSYTTVGFGDLTIYEFPNILGYAATPKEGCPIEIGWKHKSMDQISVEYHEFLKDHQGRRRRKDLIMLSGERDMYLLGKGYSLEKLVRSAEETEKTRKSRQTNMKASSIEKFRGLFTRTFENSRLKSQTAKSA